MMATARRITYASVCDGIGAVHVAWAPLGWTCRWVSEIDPFPIAVVERRFGLQNVGDMTKITEADIGRYGAIDLLVGGTPCQSFSVAGLRKGLDDPRGNLALRFCQLADVLRPRWVLWENVPGVLSSDEGRAFASIIGALVECGYGLAWRILDAQYFGVPQRRRRMFVVGHLGDWRRAAAVLLERQSLCGHPAPSRQAGTRVAHSLARGSCSSHGRYDPNGEDYVTCPLTQNQYADNEARESLLVARSLRADGFDASEDGTGRGTPLVPVPFDPMQVTSAANRSNPRPGDPCHTLPASHEAPAIAFKRNYFTDRPEQSGRPQEVAPPLTSAQAERSDGETCVAYRTSGNCGVTEQGDRTAALNCNTDRTQQIIAFQCQGSNVGPAGHLRAGNGNETGGVPFIFQTRVGRNGRGQPKEIADALTSSEAGSHADSKPHVAGRFGVRRLMPRECERLQGFPDDYTLIDFRGKPAKDGPRYKALGNSMAVPVMRWIGQRIMQVEALA